MATSSWSGFSLEDQAKIKSQLDTSRSTTNEAGNDLRNADSSVNKEVKPIQKKSKPGTKKIPYFPNSDANSTCDLPSEALFSSKPTRQDRGPESPVHVKLKISEDTSSFEIMETAPLGSDAECGGEEARCSTEQESNHCDDHPPASQSPNFTLDVDLLQNGGKKEIVNLDEFEKKQKLIEEQNRIKKQMLAKALAMRKMKTQAEALKLHQIQEELSKLDANLSNDVCILRGHIEIASVELAEAEKRYTKAEREFVESKQLLFSKRERKDLLTEHLCTIIEQTELRKAHRLTDLMIQLDDEDHRTTEVPLNRLLEPVTTTDAV